MKQSEIKLKVNVLNSLEDLIGKTITYVSYESNYMLLKSNNDVLLITYEIEHGRCGDYETNLVVNNDIIYELGVENSNSLGLLDEEDYKNYKNFLDQELKNKEEEKLRIENDKIKAKEKSDYEQYMKLKNQFENKN